LKFGPDKGELRMRRSNYGPLQWRLAAPAPGTVARSRRWNLVLIAVLAFLVLGVFVVAEAPRRGSSASNSADALWKESASPASVQPAKSVRGTPLETHGQVGPEYLHKDLKSGHHSS
jgi:hypothetical protein